MGHYNKGIESQKTIIKACEALFYEKGYAATTYKDIGEKANVRVGIISYHFGNVLAIATQIASEEIDKIQQRVREVFVDKEAPDIVLATVGYLVYLDVFFRDWKYRRFHVELEAASMEKYDPLGGKEYNNQYSELTTAIYKNEYYELLPKDNPLLVEFYFSLLPFINLAVSRFCCEHLGELTPELALRYSLDFLYRMYHFEEQEFDDIINQSVALKDQLLIGNDGFRVMIQRKDQR